jgi:hypothetical protein
MPLDAVKRMNHQTVQLDCARPNKRPAADAAPLAVLGEAKGSVLGPCR